MLKLASPSGNSGSYSSISQLAVPSTGTFYPYNNNYTLSIDPTNSARFATAVPSSASTDIRSTGYPTYRASQFCAQCHTRYMRYRSVTAASVTVTFTGDTIFAYQHPTNLSPGCLTCHDAHGTSAAMTGYASPTTGTVFYPGSTTVHDDSVLLRISNRGVCIQCHAK